MKPFHAIAAHFYRRRFWYGAVLVFLTAFWFRNMIAERDLAAMRKITGSDFAPQLVEGAMMYGYVDRIAGGENVGGTDPKLAVMQHRKAAEQMSLSMEYVYGGILRLKRLIGGNPIPGECETSTAESALIRVIQTALLALVPMLVFLWLGVLRVPWIWAVLGALVETFTKAAVMKYTGQDLLKGAFAFPLVTLFLVLAVYSCRRYSVARYAAAAVAAFLAIACWDETQIIIGAWALGELFRRLVGGASSRKRFCLWIGIGAALLAASVLLPYHRAHGLFFSPVVQWLLPAAIAVNFPWRDRTPGFCFSGVLEVVSLTGLCGYWWRLVSLWSDFGENYSHFASLLQAKIQFLNRKPDNPMLLNFDQRYLWTPDLHSVNNWSQIEQDFPAALPLFLVLTCGILLLLVIRRRKLHFAMPYRIDLFRILLYTLGFFAAYCFFARFRDFTALFLSVGFGLTGALWHRQYLGGFRNTRKKRRWGYQLIVLMVIAAAGFVVFKEYRNTCRIPRTYPPDLRNTAELIRYLRRCDLEHSVILSDMTLSPLFFGYVKSKIVIQPKYELPEVRQVTQEFLETFFNGSVPEFERFCESCHADYLIVHKPMLLNSPRERNCPRYMTATFELLDGTPAKEFLLRPRMLNAFAELHFPEEFREVHATYSIYRFVNDRQRTEAEKLQNQAMQALYCKDLPLAMRKIREAYRLDPVSKEVQGTYFKIFLTTPPPPRIPLKTEAVR